MITVTQETINSRAITIKVTPENVALGFSLQAKQYRDEAEVFKDTCEGVQVVLQDLIDNLSEVLEVQTELPEILELHSKLTELLAIFNKLSTLDSVYASLTEIEAVSAKLVEITTLYTNIASIQNVNDNIASIVTVASDSTVINSIYDNLTKIDTLYTNILAIISLYTNIGVLQTLNSNITELQGIYTELTKLVSVYTNLASILAVEAKLTEISAVYAKLTQITAIYNSLTQLQTLYTNLSALLNVEADLTNINIVATDIAKVIITANNIDSINTNAVNIQAIIDAPAFAQLAEDYANKAEDSEVETGKYSALHWAAKSEGFADDSEISKLASQAAQGLSEDARDLSEKWAEETEDVEVTTGKYSAKHWANKSEDQAIIAKAVVDTEIPALLANFFDTSVIALSVRVDNDSATVEEKLYYIQQQLADIKALGIQPMLAYMPGVYKVGKTYSVIPENGSGDFTCVRATTPNRVNKDGDTEVVPINTPVIDWSTGSPLLIVSTVGELTLTTPATATKVIITVNGVATEYNNIFPTLTLPIGSISTVIATVGGTEYDLLKAYLLRVSADSGIITEVGATITKDFFKNNEDTGITPTLALLAGSGQKVAKLHSQLPTDGSGDFTVSRTTSKVITNKGGNLQTIAANVPPVTWENGVPVIQPERQTTQLLTRPISFGHTDWTKSGAVIEGDASTATGEELVVNGDFKLGTGTDADNWIEGIGWARVDDGSGNFVMSSDGSQTSDSYLIQTIIAPINKLYLCSVSISNYTTGNVRFQLGTGTSGYILTANGNYIFYITVQNANQQLLLTANPDFVGTIDNVSVKEVQGFAAPAVDENGDVLLDAYKLVATVNNGYIRLATPKAIINGSTHANGIYIKRVTGSGVVNLIGINGSDIPKTITTSWTKISDARAATSTSGQIGIKLATAGDEVLIYNAQLELGRSATSPVYIDKSLEGAQRTRTQDDITGAGNATLFADRNSSGVLFVHTKLNSILPESDTAISIRKADGGTGANRVALFYRATGKINALLRVGGVSNQQLEYTLPNMDAFHKIAIRWNTTTFTLWIDGVSVGTLITNVSNNTFPSNTLDELNFNIGNTLSPFYGKAESIKVLPYLDDTAMAILTTL